MRKKEKVLKIKEIFNIHYPEADCTLKFKDPFTLMVSAQLATQCTDARVNTITPILFKKYPDVFALAEADIKELEEIVKPTGFYRNKAKNLIGAARILVSEYVGKVPNTMEDLLRLPGVGRKIANLILGDAFGIPGIVVDTHAGRITRRLGLTKNTDPYKVEMDLVKVVPKDYMTLFCHQLVFHGRAICTARSPKCGICPISEYCDYYKKAQKNT